MKIINIVENLDKGSVENWLVSVFLESRSIRPDWEWSFYCILDRKGRLDEIVLKSGGKIIYSPMTISNKLKFLLHLRKVLKLGKYDIIHSHHDFLSGFYGLATLGINFKKRILHIHNTDQSIPVGSELLRRILLTPLKHLALYFNDLIVGISKDALNLFVDGNKRGIKKSKILYCGILLDRFEGKIDENLFRQEQKMPKSAKILLFVGRMNELKNPAFVVEILFHIHKKRDDVYAVFIGEGVETKKVIEKAKESGIQNYIRVLGWRNDVQNIMKSSDVFVFPRLEYPKEGLGLVVVEAQAAGLPMVISRAIVEDAIVINDLAFYLPLDDNSEEWADKVLEILLKGKFVSQELAYNLIAQSDFELKTATLNFINLYE